jgi:hypothetical protein
MTEAEWLASTEPDRMLDLVRHTATGRKLRLFACACARRVWRLMSEASRNAVAASERFADRLITRHELAEAAEAARSEEEHPVPSHEMANQAGVTTASTSNTAFWVAAVTAEWTADATVEHLAETLEEQPDDEREDDLERVSCTEQLTRCEQCDLLRDIFCPFHAPATDPSWRSWNGGTLVRMAQAVYQERAFDRLPILADAVEEAGCTSAPLLDHLRSPGPHVLGCWGLDVILGKR